MDLTQDIFKYKKADFCKLENYGFKKKGASLVYETLICDGDMRLTVSLDETGRINTEVYDLESEEKYTLFLVESAEGEFVGKVRAEYTRVLEDICAKCFINQAFRCKNTQKLFSYARSRYGDEPEFLWNDLPDCAVLRRKDTNKWYAVIMTVAYRKLGVERDGTAEIVDLRIDPAELDKLVDNVTYFRGWHMNKKHWATMLLDGTAEYSELEKRLDFSFSAAIK